MSHPVYYLSWPGHNKTAELIGNMNNVRSNLTDYHQVLVRGISYLGH